MHFDSSVRLTDGRSNAGSWLQRSYGSYSALEGQKFAASPGNPLMPKALCKLS